jgi:hypothetical protein
MAGTLTISTLSDGTNSTSATNCIQGSAKAWVNFNGTGTPAIRASYNVSSLTNNGTGDYTVNFTNAFADANYAVNVSAGRGSGTGLFPELGLSAPTTSGVRVAFINSAISAYATPQYAMVSVFR